MSIEMHAHQRRCAGRRVVPRTSARCTSRLHVVLVGDSRNSPNSVSHRLLGDALDRALVAQAVADQVGDRADLEPMLRGEGLEIRAARHRAVVVHDLDDHRGGLEAGEARQIAAGFGVAGARQHAAGLRHEREDVPGWRRSSGRASARTAVRTVCARSCAEMPVVTPSAASMDTREVGALLAIGLADHQRQAQLRGSARASASGRSGRGRSAP